SQQRGSVAPRSHHDLAPKAFERVTRRVLARQPPGAAARARGTGALVSHEVGELEKRATLLGTHGIPRSVTKPWHYQGFPRCAEEDSNLHGGIPPQGPQPCASTNSATGAGARAE